MATLGAFIRVAGVHSPCGVQWAKMGGPLVRIDGKLTASRYSSLLQDTMLPYVLDGPIPNGCFLFQQNKSPMRMACQVTILLEDPRCACCCGLRMVPTQIPLRMCGCTRSCACPDEICPGWWHTCCGMPFVKIGMSFKLTMNMFSRFTILCLGGCQRSFLQADSSSVTKSM